MKTIGKTMIYCSKCKSQDKPLMLYTLLTSKKTNKQTRYAMCRECNNQRCREYYKNNKEQARQTIYRSINKHKERQAARARLNYHVQKGTITKPTVCSSCKEEKPRIEGHHHDYTKPLEVTWLCTDCHADQDRAWRLKQT